MAHWACGDGKDGFGLNIDYSVAHKCPWGKNRGKYMSADDLKKKFDALRKRMNKRS